MKKYTIIFVSIFIGLIVLIQLNNYSNYKWQQYNLEKTYQGIIDRYIVLYDSANIRHDTTEMRNDASALVLHYNIIKDNKNYIKWKLVENSLNTKSNFARIIPCARPHIGNNK